MTSIIEPLSPESEENPEQLNRVDRHLENNSETYPDGVNAIYSESDIKNNNDVKVWVELEEEVDREIIEDVLRDTFKGYSHIYEEIAADVWEELGFEYNIENVVEMYTLEDNPQKISTDDENFTEGNFSFLVNTGDGAQVVMYEGKKGKERFEEKIVDGNKVLVKKSDGRNIKRKYTQEIKWDGSEFFIGEQHPHKWGKTYRDGEKKDKLNRARATVLADYLDHLNG